MSNYGEIRKKYLSKKIEHLDPESFDCTALINQMENMSFQARNLARGCKIFDQMITETDCTNILCLSGSLISAGLKEVILSMVRNNMIDCIVSTGANMVDMDFFEALGFNHYIGDTRANDEELRLASIDRIYDTYISEFDLRVCDAATSLVADLLTPAPHSSREFCFALGHYLAQEKKGENSILRTCFEKNVPIFIPSLSDCSAGFGLVMHQKSNPDAHMSHDSVKDFSELGELVINSKSTGIFMIGGGVPKNFTQDTVVLAELLGQQVAMHKYAIQVTVADERDGALSGSTLKEAHSWGKVDEGAEQMIFSEATIALPLIVNYGLKMKNWQNRKEKCLNNLFPKIEINDMKMKQDHKFLFEALKERERSLLT